MLQLRTQIAEDNNMEEERTLSSADIMCGDLFDHIDDLLDFPNEDEVFGVGGDPCVPAQSMPLSSAVLASPPPLPPLHHRDDSGTANTTAAASEDNKLMSEEEPVAYDDLDIAEMEWLSNFFDESSDPPTLCFNNAYIVDKDSDFTGFIQSRDKDDSSFRASSPVSVLEHTNLAGGSGSSTATVITTSSSSSSSSCSGVGYANKTEVLAPPLSPSEPFVSPIVPGRARSKRLRPPASSRPLVCAPIVPPPPSSASLDVESFGEFNPTAAMMTAKKRKTKKSPPPVPGEEPADAQAPPMRKCLHCGIQKTPQWRAGPMGPKTLCNACGVRYKSGRLFPEYRPAASPTFVPSLHSNSHKKVAEMRIKASQNAAAAAAAAAHPESPALKNCDLIQYIRRRI